MKIKEFQHKPVQPDTYEASMALQQLMRIAKCGMKLHNMIDNDAEMESWVAKKIDLAGDYVKKVYNYTEADKAGLYDDSGMSEMKKMPKGTGTMQGVKEDAGDMDALKKWLIKYSKYRGMNGDKLPFGLYMQMAQTGVPTDGMEAGEARQAIADQNPSLDPTDADAMAGTAEEIPGVDFDKADAPITNAMKSELADIMGVDAIGEEEITKAMKMLGLVKESVSEDAGEGHMSKSTLYHTVKYAIQLMDMIKKGDDLEGWVQSKLNKAADYLQGAANYEEYQRLNPYREELDPSLMQKHAGVIQKNIDEILDKETKLDDIDTKPGMMRILSKRVNEVEKEIAKETRKKSDVKEDGHMDIPSAIRNCETIIEDAMQMKQKLETMQGELPSWMTQMIAVAASDLNDARDYLLNPTTESGIMYRAGVKKYGKKGMTAIQSAAGKGASHQEIGKIKDKYVKDDEQFDEGLKDWAKGVMAAGVIVGAVAGMGSINDAIDNSVPAIKAMNTALEMAQDSGNDELAKMIEKDLRDAKLRLDTGKDLNQVKFLQDKYSKFMPTEGLAYESKLAIMLNQQLK